MKDTTGSTMVIATGAAGMVIGLYSAVYIPLLLGKLFAADSIHRDPFVYLMLALLVVLPFGVGIPLARLQRRGQYRLLLQSLRWLALLGACYEVYRIAT